MEREFHERFGLLGAKVRELRRARGLTQEQVAARAEVSVGAVRDLEQGGVCGPLVIKRNGAESRDLPAGQRAVLGMLALSAGMAVMADSIIGALWPDGPPVTAAGIVQTYVSRLRGVFGYSGGREGCITRDGAGCRLRLSAGGLDLLAFWWRWPPAARLMSGCTRR